MHFSSHNFQGPTHEHDCSWWLLIWEACIPGKDTLKSSMEWTSIQKIQSTFKQRYSNSPKMDRQLLFETTWVYHPLRVTNIQYTIIIKLHCILERTFLILFAIHIETHLRITIPNISHQHGDYHDIWCHYRFAYNIIIYIYDISMWIPLCGHVKWCISVVLLDFCWYVPHMQFFHPTVKTWTFPGCGVS